MKTFQDLEFKEHRTGKPYFNKHAIIKFDNDYGISVINGDCANCDDVTFEVAILFDDDLCYTTEFTSDVLEYQTEEDITLLMNKLQQL